MKKLIYYSFAVIITALAILFYFAMVYQKGQTVENCINFAIVPISLSIFFFAEKIINFKGSWKKLLVWALFGIFYMIVAVFDGIVNGLAKTYNLAKRDILNN